MNKAELIAVVESRLGSRKAAIDAVEAVFDTIIREVARGGKVGITGFGTFEPVVRAARTGRNPRTGQSVRIEGTTVPKFKAGTAFKSVVADPSTLPETGESDPEIPGPSLIRRASPRSAPSQGARSPSGASGKSGKRIAR